MRFINPKTDFAFKKIFGSDQCRDILISFLNGLLYEGKDTITSVDIIDPYLAPKIAGMKDTYVDVRARLSDESTVIIEMQILNVEGFEKRVLYNATKAYGDQLVKGFDYTSICPVIALTITDFVMFPNIEKYSSRFFLKESELMIDYPNTDLILAFVELPKFDREVDFLENLAEKWLYFIKHARDLRAVPAKLSAVPEIKHAFDVAEEANLDPDELADLNRREIYIIDQRGMIVNAKKEGHEEGRTAERHAVARAMLRKGADPIFVSETTGLSIDEINHLKNS